MFVLGAQLAVRPIILMPVCARHFVGSLRNSRKKKKTDHSPRSWRRSRQSILCSRTRMVTSRTLPAQPLSIVLCCVPACGQEAETSRPGGPGSPADQEAETSRPAEISRDNHRPADTYTQLETRLFARSVQASAIICLFGTDSDGGGTPAEPCRI